MSDVSGTSMLWGSAHNSEIKLGGKGLGLSCSTREDAQRLQPGSAISTAYSLHSVYAEDADTRNASAENAQRFRHSLLQGCSI